MFAWICLRIYDGTIHIGSDTVSAGTLAVLNIILHLILALLFSYMGILLLKRGKNLIENSMCTL